MAGGCFLNNTRMGKTSPKKLDISPSKLQRLFAFLLSLHDLGKFPRAFQNLVPNQSESLVEYIEDYRYTERHDSLGFWLVKQSPAIHAILAEISDISAKKVVINKTFNSWLQMVMGHHGQPPKTNIKKLFNFYTDDDQAAAASFVQEKVSLWLECDDVP